MRTSGSPFVVLASIQIYPPETGTEFNNSIHREIRLYYYWQHSIRKLITIELYATNQERGPVDSISFCSIWITLNMIQLICQSLLAFEQ